MIAEIPQQLNISSFFNNCVNNFIFQPSTEDNALHKSKLQLKAYLANQLGFSALFSNLLHDFKGVIEELEIKVYEPFEEGGRYFSKDFERIGSIENHVEKRIAWESLSEKLARLNIKLMNDSDCLIALLDGGHAVDDGVSSEIGYYAGIKRGPIFGLRTDSRLADNMGSPINLQIHEFIKLSKGKLIDYSHYGSDCINVLLKAIENWKNLIL